MPNEQLDAVKKKIAISQHYTEILGFLDVLLNAVADVRTPIGANDTVESRRAITEYLAEQLASIRRMRDTLQHTTTGRVPTESYK